MASARCVSSRVGAASLLVGVCLLCGVNAFDFSLGLIGGEHQTTGHATDELNANTFEDYMKAGTTTAVLFYAPWCFYSQQVMPAWDEAGRKLKVHDPPVRLAKIDASRYGSIGDKYGVQAFPTMKLFIDGNVLEYTEQGRGWQQIVKWVNLHLDRDHVLKNVDDADHWMNDNELAVIGLFGDDHTGSKFVNSSRHFDDISFAESRGKDISTEIGQHIAKHATLLCETIDVGQGSDNKKTSELPREFMTCEDAPRNPQRSEWTDKYHNTVDGKTLTTQRMDKTEGWAQFLQMRCCDTETADHKAKLHVVTVPSIVMFFPHDERFATYDGDLEDVHKIDKWISARRVPMVQRLNQQTAEHILGAAQGPDKPPMLFLVSNTPDDPLEKHIREAAKLVRGRAVVILAGLSSPIEKRLADMAGIDEEQLPVVALVEAQKGGGGNDHTSKKYRMETNGLTAAKVATFIDDYENGRLTPFLRSEPLPSAEELNGPVGIAVGLNFREVSQAPGKDVLIDFYAPWCGHCRKFEPLYKTLGKKLQHVKTLKIMKLDATRNEMEGMFIQGFPTIVLFQAGSSPKRQIRYEGSRQPDDMVQWLKQHCSNSFDERPPAVTEEEDEPASGLLDEAEEADL